MDLWVGVCHRQLYRQRMPRQIGRILSCSIHYTHYIVPPQQIKSEQTDEITLGVCPTVMFPVDVTFLISGNSKRVMGITNFSFSTKLISIHRCVPYFCIYVISSYHSFDCKCEYHWSTSHMHAVMIKLVVGLSRWTVFVNYKNIWELSFLNSPKFYHCQYSKLVYSSMFS